MTGNNRESGIRIWDRAAQRNDIEKVYGEEWIRSLYGTAAGRVITERLLAGRWVSHCMGLWESSVLSRRKIEPFIREFGIRMEEFEEGPFKSFNDFFIRRFREGKRPFVATSEVMPAFAEGRYFGFENTRPGQVFPVKGLQLSAASLLGGEAKAQLFSGGPLLLARLCPTDYHRFHFPDQGKVLEHYRIPGSLHSVNPVALGHRGDILVTNERQVTILETENFGKLAYVEVGALCVGKIVQTYAKNNYFSRGGEKGYFLFGASTVIVIGQEGRWRPDDDLLERTRSGVESLIKLGEGLAYRNARQS